MVWDIGVIFEYCSISDKEYELLLSLVVFIVLLLINGKK